MNKNLLRQAQQLQLKMAKIQEELDTASVEASSGGGVVKVIMSGKLKLESIKIDPQVVNKNDVAMLEDLILAAVREGISSAQELANKKMSEITGGLNIPGTN